MGQNKYSQPSLYVHNYAISAKCAQSIYKPTCIDLFSPSPKNTLTK